MIITKYDLFDMFDYEISQLKDVCNYDLFISAYNNEAMVRTVYENIQAQKKIWLKLPDYNDLDIIEENIYENKDVCIQDSDLESNYINSFAKDCKLDTFKDKSICIDITGFIKPYMIYLIFYLAYMKFSSITILYSEPKQYTSHEDTIFSKETIINSRGIIGFDQHKNSVAKENDLFIINAGYDYKLLINIAGFRKDIKTRKILLGFPSLQPIMYQENILNLQKASTELNISYDFMPMYAAANNPFDTAKAINNFVLDYIEKNRDVETIMLAPLATKPQALGMTLFAILEEKFLEEKGIIVNIVYPFTKAYSSSAGKELFRINGYKLSFNQ